MGDNRFLGTYFISRKPIEDEDEDGGITIEEWKEVIEHDPSLEEIDFIWGRSPITGENYKIPLKGGAKWKNNPDKTNIPFSWNNGKIICQSISEASFCKVKEIAMLLHAICIEDDY